MILDQALTALAPALIVTPRFVTVTALIKDCCLTAYNGNVAGCVPLDQDYGTVALNAERLRKAWTPNAKMTFGETWATIKSGKITTRLHQLPLDTPCPEFIETTLHILTCAQVDAILLAANFASLNAVYPWACSVNLTHNGIIATNNQTLVHVPCPFDYELSLPFWAVDLLKREGALPRIGYSDNMILFEWGDGVQLQAHRLSAEMPPAVFSLAETLTPALEPINGAAALLTEADKLDSRYVTLSPEGLHIETVDKEEVVAETSFSGQFKLSIETARLVFAHATHISFDDAPGKLRFFKETEPQLMGFAAGMS